MWLRLLVGVFAVFLVAGGGYQVLTGRYVGVGKFRSDYNPSARWVRILGAAGIFIGLLIVFVLIVPGSR